MSLRTPRNSRWRWKLAVGVLGILPLTTPAHAEFGDLIWTLTPVGFDREAFSGSDFGGQVAIYDSLGVVGGDNDIFHGEDAGTVWTFDLTTGQALAVLDPPDIAPGDGLAESLAIYQDTVLVTSDSRNEDRGLGFVFNGRTGEYQGSIGLAGAVAGEEFGQASGINDRWILISAEDSDAGQGAGYLYDAATRTFQRKLSANDPTESEVGDTAAISGDYALLGSAGNAVYLFDAPTGNLRHKFTVAGGGAFGASIATSGNLAVAAAPELEEEKGAAYILHLDTATFGPTLLASDGAAGHEFGDRVAIDGNTVLVASANIGDDAGAVYVFDAVTGMQVAKLVSPNPAAGEEFGSGVSIHNGIALIGAEEGVVQGQGSGIAYVFNVSFTDLADVDDNGIVDGADVDAISAAIRAGSTDAAYDVNHDGAVNSADRELWVAALNHSFFGDANLDGEFNTGDLVTVFTAGEYEDAIAGNSGWSTGDWDGDGDFATGDLVLAFTAGAFENGPRAATAAVPEPTGFSLIAGVAALCGFVRRAASARK